MVAKYMTCSIWVTTSDVYGAPLNQHNDENKAEDRSIKGPEPKRQWCY